VTRRPRVPGTGRRRPPDLCFELATAGQNVERLSAALTALVPPGSLVDVHVHHDDGCACLEGGSMLACTCEIVGVRVRYAPRAEVGA
jgi:hypothetical protein